MANPKRRHSKTRRDKRRANWKISVNSISICPRCNQSKLPIKFVITVVIIKIGKL